jgi:transglutaminase-like putative cysteine protease
MRYQITHHTQYVYDEPASLCYNEARLTPRTFATPLFRQTCHAKKIQIEPDYNDYHERLDFFGNETCYFTVRNPHERTVITAVSQVELEPLATFAELAPDLPWETAKARLRTDFVPDILEAREFVMNSPMVSVSLRLADFAAPSFPPGRPVLEAAYHLMERIYREFKFKPGVTNIATPLSEVLEKKQGVCQDFAHLLVGCLRAQGLAARYISGYIETLPPPGTEKLVGADASHAWGSVFVPEMGWIDFDPTNNLVPRDQHITLAWGRDFSDVTPLKGVFFSQGQHHLQVSVDVARLKNEP